MGIGLLENLIVLGFVAGISVGLPTGPPAVEPVCVDLKPAFYAPHFLQEGNGTYGIKTGVPASNNSNYFGYTAGETYNVTISAGSGIGFKGFLVQAWDPSEIRIGSFTPGDGMRFLNCSKFKSIADEATICHSRRNTNPTVSFTWTAPAEGDGLVDFRFTIVRQLTQYYGPLSAASPNGIIPNSSGAGVVSALFILLVVSSLATLFNL